MITISLDEYGAFEFSNEEKRDITSLIGGIIFSCRDDEDIKNELQRLQDFFRMNCEDLGCSYPRDLHYERENGEIVNAEAATTVKSKLIENLSDFLLGNGNWASKPPKGNYSFYALVTDKHGIEKMTKPGISNLINDNFATNRYEHMAYRTIENLLFYNPYLIDDNVKLELATRSALYSHDFKKISHSKNHNRDSFIVTDSTGYRAALGEALLKSDRKNINFDLNVQSINYKPDGTCPDAEKKGSNYWQGFLYLADTLCSFFADIIVKNDHATSILQSFIDHGNKVLGSNQTYVFSYSEIDQVYRKAYSAAKRGEFFQALFEINNPEISKLRHLEFYNKYWFNSIKNIVTSNSEPIRLEVALTRLENYLNDTNSNLNVAKYIFEVLNENANQFPENGLSEKLLFKLYYIQIKICNHMGDYVHAQDAFEKCVPMAQYISVEDYLELRNLYSVLLLDKQKTHEALMCTKQTADYEELLVEMKKEIFPENNDVFIHYGRTLSQLAQCYANLGMYEKSAEFFEKALSKFGTDEKERSFTLSLYLHALIEMGDLSTYKRYAEQYFGNTKIKKQYKLIWNQDVKAQKFMLYVYIKALFFYYKEKMDAQSISELIKTIEDQYSRTPDAHPWEMILKYCAFLELFINNYQATEHSDYLMKLAEESVSDSTDGIIQKIVLDNQMQYKRLCDTKGALLFSDDSDLIYMFR